MSYCVSTTCTTEDPSTQYFVGIELDKYKCQSTVIPDLLNKEQMNSLNYSAGEKLYKTGSNSTCIQVKQVPISPTGDVQRTVK